MPTPLSIKYLAAYDDLEKADAGGISLASPAHRQRVLDKMSRLKKVPSLAAIADPAVAGRQKLRGRTVARSERVIQVRRRLPF